MPISKIKDRFLGLLHLHNDHTLYGYLYLSTYVLFSLNVCSNNFANFYIKLLYQQFNKMNLEIDTHLVIILNFKFHISPLMMVFVTADYLNDEYRPCVTGGRAS